MLVGGSIIANAVMEDYNALARREEETIRLRAEAEAMVKAAREGAEENKKLFRVRQELNNLKAANAVLVKEKAAAEAAGKEAETRGATALKEAEARAAKLLADADANRTKLSKVVEELQAEVQSRVTILEEVISRATEAEAREMQAEERARQVEEVRDGLTTSLGQVTADHAWMREHAIGHIMESILDAPKNTTAVAEMNERAHQAGFKAGYNKCLSDVNPFFTSRFTDERSGFPGVDTEATYDAALDAYNKLSIPALDDIEKCLGAEDYVDRLHKLFEPLKEDEGTSGAKAD
ncbi:uncharacterized protein LOC118485114 [Helianthus annuus]|uniref:uncharacterized protein LOC118485114 n=1 Tax=Helianthus annuus TaxID=4232 RepID=UPI0016532741|nr:uncharacterized protein LOC118485114 [Helianthus annuus]